MGYCGLLATPPPLTSSVVYFFKVWPLWYFHLFTTSPFFFDGPACSSEVLPLPPIFPAPLLSLANTTIARLWLCMRPILTKTLSGGRYTSALVEIQVAGRWPRHSSISISSSQFVQSYFRVSVARFEIQWWDSWFGKRWKDTKWRDVGTYCTTI